MGNSGAILSAAEYVRSDKDVHFIGALVQGAVETANISFPQDWVDAQVHRCEVLGIVVMSKEQLAWDVKFYGKDTHAVTSNLDLDSIAYTFKLNESDGIQEGSTPANQYYYDLDPDRFPFVYQDEDLTSEFHITLVNRSVSAKTATTVGEIVIIIHAVPIMC